METTKSTNPIIDKINQEDLNTNVALAIESAENTKVRQMNEKSAKKVDNLEELGFNNKTVKARAAQKIEVEEAAKEAKLTLAKLMFLKGFSNALFPFKVVPYSVMDELAKKYNLIIVPNGWYNEGIPEEAVEDIKGFNEKIKGLCKNEDFANMKCFTKNTNFSFDNDEFTRSVQNTEIDKLFKIMAPAPDCDVPSDAVQIGNEMAVPKVGEAKFKYVPQIELYKKPDPDPVVFVPVNIQNQIHCVVITGWDEVYNDEKLRLSLVEDKTKLLN